MNVVGKVSSFITQGVYSVATPFHPFGGAVDIIVVKQHDGTFRSTPWYVRFGKFQGVLKGAEKVVRIEVNGKEADFHMYLDNSGEAYFIKEATAENENEENGGLKESDNLKSEGHTSNLGNGNHKESRKDDKNEEDEYNAADLPLRDERVTLGLDRLNRADSDADRRFYEFDEQSSLDDSVDLSEYGSSRYDNLESMEHVLESQDSSSEVVLVSVDGHILTAPISKSERNTEDVELDTPQFHLGPGQGTEFNSGDGTWADDYFSDLNASEVSSADTCNVKNESTTIEHQLEVSEVYGKHLDRTPENDLKSREVDICMSSTVERTSCSIKKDDVFQSCLELSALAIQAEDEVNKSDTVSQPERVVEDVKEKSHENGTHDSDLSCSSLSRDLQLEGVNLQKGDLELEHNASDSARDDLFANDEHSKEQTDVTVEVDQVQSGQQGSDESTECDTLEHQTAALLKVISAGVDISLCRNLLHAGMGSVAAREAFEANRISEEEFRNSAKSIINNPNLAVRIQGNYLQWDKAAPIVLGMAAYNMELPVDSTDVIPVEEQDKNVKTGEDDSGLPSTPSGRRWRLWPMPFRRVKTIEHTSSNMSNEEVFVDSESISLNQPPTEQTATPQGGKESPRKQLVRTNVPTTGQIESLKLKEGQNLVTFIFSTRVLGEQKVEAHIYLWKWNTRIVISDVDGTITKSDVLGQFMPLVGKDWTHSGIARLFCAIKENGYQLLFLSARAIVQAYLTKSFLFNLKQDGKSLPPGPVVISPDGLFPSLYREVIRRAPHEFKIACLEDIKALFPPDYNPFYAGFGNRDTDELSYRKIGIPKGKIFIINPKGEVAINHQIDVKSYTSLHTLVNDMFPPTSMVEQEDFNLWNYWKMPLADIDNL
ncbi:phosphatidate phosphatase PAH1-like isoform X1 [Lycium ferocissimum]|uniref:phosphatidate phosphatase PAH1-like isoform X1 n=1 Tax=Lycium ferocissimum TaxID=112874 RepID=UPI002815CD1A|nr:phosphatidate phosphatase PAH1-like isoform X1 [Lycium ferocissimum]XP_059305670.1 phosphatidate phosphatase PAH1-like isoform X1 [Lycium ferocissimum]XP_059305671.1 phosphatidate phosphatase PAH1-like isoform X1 [Lycium ferocissimum]